MRLTPHHSTTYPTLHLGHGQRRTSVPDSPTAKRSRASALAEDGTLNPAPRKVNDPKFREESFFDPRDI